jgi:hypothetical protein
MRTLHNVGRRALRLSGVTISVCSAISAVSAAEIPALQFSIKPRICILSEAEQTCYDQLEVKWTAAEKMNLCLHQSEQSRPIKCWSETQQGEHKFQLTADHSVTFQLREFNQTTLASEHFEVIHHRKSFRRQRRNPWSFF